MGWRFAAEQLYAWWMRALEIVDAFIDLTMRLHP